MKKVWSSVVTTVCVCCIFATGAFAASKADVLYTDAQRLEKVAQYTEAADSYKKALPLYEKDGNGVKAARCRAGFRRIHKIKIDYPYTEEQAKEAIRKQFPKVPTERIVAWLKGSNVERLVIDGTPHYFYSIDRNFAFRNYDVGRSCEPIHRKYTTYYKIIRALIERNAREVLPEGAVFPYKNPAVYRGKWSITVRHSELPRNGILKIWMPLPILVGPQSDVRDISISPAAYVKLPARTDADIGLVYLEVPLEELEDDLAITASFSFTHYEQRFVIDPNNIGSYDKNDDLYRTYTASRGNTTITEAIRKQAKTIVGNEKNPYRAARKIYDFVVSRVYYSIMPHYSLNARNYPESVYVHRQGYGDCGAQSSYFCALCRAVGIPARSTGGYQMVETTGIGSGHFWAQFYLPNYGWIPVDTSIAQLPDYLPELSDTESAQYKDYFFANLDPYRLVIQKDIDLPLTPPATEPIMLPMAIQNAEALCDTMLEHPGALVSENWKYEIRPIEEGSRRE